MRNSSDGELSMNERVTNGIATIRVGSRNTERSGVPPFFQHPWNLTLREAIYSFSVGHPYRASWSDIIVR